MNTRRRTATGARGARVGPRSPTSTGAARPGASGKRPRRSAVDRSGDGPTAFTFRTWGGKREGAGRPPAPGKARRVAHAARPRLASRFPVHVTLRVREDVPNLRARRLWAALRGVFAHCCGQSRFRICQFSVQGSHMHLICEAADAGTLAKGMQRVASMLARRINKPAGRRGSVFVDRYHQRIIRTPSQARHALCYVLHNARRHGVSPGAQLAGTDPFSSAWYFDGWRESTWRRIVGPPEDEVPPVSPARTWLLAKGWRRHGLLATDEVPPAAIAD